MYLYNLTHTFSVCTIMNLKMKQTKKENKLSSFLWGIWCCSNFFIPDPFTCTLLFLLYFLLFFLFKWALSVHPSELSSHEVSFFSVITAWSWSYNAVTNFCSPLNKINYVWIMNLGRACVLGAYTRTWRHNGLTAQICLWTNVNSLVCGITSQISLLGLVSQHCPFSSFFHFNHCRLIYRDFSLYYNAWIYFFYYYSFSWKSLFLAKVWKEGEFWNLEIPALSPQDALLYERTHISLELLIKIWRFKECWDFLT